MKRLDVTNTMNLSQVLFVVTFLLEYMSAKLTLKTFDVTDTVSVAQVVAQSMLIRELPAANLAFVPGVRVLWSTPTSVPSLGMRRVVVSVDR